MANESSDFRYLSVLISSKGLTEMDDDFRAVFIPREDIQRIEVKTGSAAERPLVQIIAATVLILFGLLGAKAILAWFQNGGKMTLGPIGMVSFMGLGFWLLWNVLRKRTYLLVTTKDDSRKIVFYGKIDPAELQTFLLNGQQTLGHTIHHQSSNTTDVT